jgi:hypothetical protein
MPRSSFSATFSAKSRLRCEEIGGVDDLLDVLGQQGVLHPILEEFAVCDDEQLLPCRTAGLPLWRPCRWRSTSTQAGMQERAEVVLIELGGIHLAPQDVRGLGEVAFELEKGQGPDRAGKDESGGIMVNGSIRSDAPAEARLPSC